MFISCLCYCCFQVEKKRQEDADNGVKIAKSLEGFVERKVCHWHFLIFFVIFVVMQITIVMCFLSDIAEIVLTSVTFHLI